MKPTLQFLCLGAALTACSASAQISLNNFSSFVSPNTFFTGDWELNGDLGGTNSPRASFSQGAGFYNFTGGSNNADAAAFVFFDTPVDISGNSFLQLSARLAAGNTAPTLTVSLFDSLGGSAFAVLPTSAFAGVGFTTISAPLTFTPGFHANDLTSFALSGNVINGADVFALSVDQLSVAAAAATPVPEASTHGLLASAFLAIGVSVRRLRRARPIIFVGSS